MITLFRRVRENLIGEGNGWRYLLYAMGEILLVVIGILIALQINNWNEERKSRAYELTMLQEVRDALEVDYQDLSSTLPYLQGIQRSFHVLTVMKSDPSASTDSLEFHLENVRGYGYVLSINTSAYEGIKSGGLDKISNPAIRNQLSYLFGYQLPGAESWINEVLRVELFNRTEHIDRLFRVEMMPGDGSDVLSRIIIEEEAIIYNNPDFDKLIRSGWPLRGTINRLTTIRDEMLELMNLIGQEMDDGR